MAGPCGCGLKSLGNRFRAVMLTLSGAFVQGGGATISLKNAQTSVPKGMFRYLDYLDIIVTASLTTGGGGSVTPAGWFELIQQITITHDIWGSLYTGGVLGREIRLLYAGLNGHFAAPDPAAMGAGAGPTTETFLIRVPLTVDGLAWPHDLRVPIHTLAEGINITFGTANAAGTTPVGTNVTINSVTITARAIVTDTPDKVMPDAWEVIRTSQSSASLDTPAGDLLFCAAMKADETFTRAQIASHTVLGYDPLAVDHDTNIMAHNADNFYGAGFNAAAVAATPVGKMFGGSGLVPNAALYYPFVTLPGRPGKRSVRETHGSVDGTTINVAGTLTPIVLVTMRRKVGGPEASKASFISAFGAVPAWHRKTGSKRPMKWDGDANGIPLKASRAG